VLVSLCHSLITSLVYTLSLHDALPIFIGAMSFFSYLYSTRSAVMTASLPISRSCMFITNFISGLVWLISAQVIAAIVTLIIELRSEEHTSELQSRFDLVCRLLLENKMI